MSNSLNSRIGQDLGCLVLIDGYTQELTEQEGGRDGTVATIYTCHSSTVRSSLATVGPIAFFFFPSQGLSRCGTGRCRSIEFWTVATGGVGDGMFRHAGFSVAPAFAFAVCQERGKFKLIA